MPYTSDELENVDFYQQYINKNRRAYLTAISDSALRGFKRSNGTLVLFQDIATEQGIENANFDLDFYSEIVPAFGRFITNNPSPGASAGNPLGSSGADGVLEFIRSKVVARHSTKYPINIKTSTLEKIIDRSISELSTVEFAETLPNGIFNGDVITNEFAADTRKWLIQNRQKRKFITIEAFFETGIPFNKLKTLTMSQLGNIPNGEPLE
jgi:hypothetical protein